MKKLLNRCPFILLLIFFSCASQKNLNLGSKINEDFQSTSMVLIPSGSFLDAITFRFENNIFMIGVNKDKTVAYVSTNDPNFEIGGFKINDEILKIFKSSKVQYAIGWGYYIKINPDWYAGFDITAKPSEHSKIKFFFKYKFSEGSKNLFKD